MVSEVAFGETPGWSREALQALAAYARAQKTTGLLLVQQGRTVLEANWPVPPEDQSFAAAFVHGRTADGALLEDVASQQKSLVAVLVGIALERRLLGLDDAVSARLGAGWSKVAPEAEAAIRVRHLMEMTSGLTDDLVAEAAPGQRFHYNTPAYARLKPVLEAASGLSLDALTRDWLTAPLGMADTDWRQRPGALAANSGNATGLVTTPRDLQKFGQMVLDGGLAADRRRVIAREQLGALFRPTAANPAYGRLWWLNGGAYAVRPTGERIEGRMVPDAPADLLMARGAHGRMLDVLPSRGLMLVRLGQQPPDADFAARLWREVLAAGSQE